MDFYVFNEKLYVCRKVKSAFLLFFLFVQAMGIGESSNGYKTRFRRGGFSTAVRISMFLS